MKHLKYTPFLFLVIILEGYIVLSTELLAIRQTIPFVGSGTDTVSIIIAAVLMPLAFGYHAGGQFKPGFHKGKYRSIRKKLISNLMVSLVILLIGLSYILLNMLFLAAIKAGFSNRLLLTTIYSLAFLVVPVYLLGQTIPLVSNYFSREKLSEITGNILFFSTIGSFLGAVFSTLVLMSWIGVHHTATLVLVLLAFLVFLLSKKKASETVLIACAIATCGIFLNSDSAMSTFNIVENNKYSTIMVFEDDDGFRQMSINNNGTSQYNDEGHKHEYVEFIENTIIQPLSVGSEPLNILVIGAGGFTLGSEDTVNRYDFVDIDESLKDISEQHLLKKPLGENKTFYPVPARAFLTENNARYDVIVLDAYLGGLSIPEHLVTLEFFTQVKAHVKENGYVVGNFITSPTLSDTFSRNLDNTIRSVMPYVSRHVVDGTYIFPGAPQTYKNTIYIYNNVTLQNDNRIYTDNKNTIFWDTPKNRQHMF